MWDLLEKHYKPNFFEHVIFKKYGYIFEDNTEDDFMKEMLKIRTQVKLEVEQLTS